MEMQKKEVGSKFSIEENRRLEEMKEKALPHCQTRIQSHLERWLTPEEMSCLEEEEEKVSLQVQSGFEKPVDASASG